MCTLSRKFLLKIVYSSSSSPDARKCRFNPNRVYFKGTQKPRAGVQGVWWHTAQGQKAWVFSYPPSNFVFKAWKTNSTGGSASAGCSTEKAREGGGSKGLDVGCEPKPEPRGHPTRQVCSGQTAPMHPEGSLGEFQVLRRAVQLSLRSLPIMHCCVSLSFHAPITRGQGLDAGWGRLTRAICRAWSGPPLRASPSPAKEGLGGALAPYSVETLHFSLPCIPWKALMRVHFADNFMTLTISPCNNIFKMVPCLQVGESRAVLFFLLPAANTALPETMVLKY